MPLVRLGPSCPCDTEEMDSINQGPGGTGGEPEGAAPKRGRALGSKHGRVRQNLGSASGGVSGSQDQGEEMGGHVATWPRWRLGA